MSQYTRDSSDDAASTTHSLGSDCFVPESGLTIEDNWSHEQAAFLLSYVDAIKTQPPLSGGPPPHAEYITSAQVGLYYGVPWQTLLAWESQFLIRTQSDTDVIYNTHDLRKLMGLPPTMSFSPEKTAIYVRSASPADTDAQEEALGALLSIYPHAEIIRDEGLGIDWNRAGLRALIDGIYAGRVDKVVVPHKDHLVTMGIEMLEYILSKHGVAIIKPPLFNIHDRISDSEAANMFYHLSTYMMCRYSPTQLADARR